MEQPKNVIKPTFGGGHAPLPKNYDLPPIFNCEAYVDRHRCNLLPSPSNDWRIDGVLSVLFGWVIGGVGTICCLFFLFIHLYNHAPIATFIPDFWPAILPTVLGLLIGLPFHLRSNRKFEAGLNSVYDAYLGNAPPPQSKVWLDRDTHEIVFEKTWLKPAARYPFDWVNAYITYPSDRFAVRYAVLGLRVEDPTTGKKLRGMINPFGIDLAEFQSFHKWAFICDYMNNPELPYFLLLGTVKKIELTAHLGPDEVLDQKTETELQRWVCECVARVIAGGDEPVNWDYLEELVPTHPDCPFPDIRDSIPAKAAAYQATLQKLNEQFGRKSF